MRTAIHHKVMRMAALLCLGSTLAIQAQAQEQLHLFYRNGSHEMFDIKDDTRIEFVKQPQLNAYWASNSRNDTIHLSASSGRSVNLGFVDYNTEWSITTDDEWLLVRRGYSVMEIGNGLEEDYFVVYATANESENRRYGKVTVTADKGGYVKEFVVVQHPYMLTLGYNHMYDDYENPVISSSTTLAWKDTACYVSIYPNHGVKVLSHPNWMELDFQSNGDDYCKFEDILKVESAQTAGTYTDTYVRFRFSQNNTPEQRTGNIIFEGHGQTAVLTVTQQGLNEHTICAEASAMMAKMYESASEGYHHDFGFPTLMLGTDSRGTDLVSDPGGYNWFEGWMAYKDLQSNLAYTYLHWTSMYNQIQAANQVINAYGERADESMFQFYLGQAYTLRAFSYFYLAQLYQQTYVGNEEAPCVPIIWEDNIYKVNAEGGRARATVREVYDYILKDLEMALNLLQQTTVSRSGKQLVNRTVVQGIRARVHMVMNNWEAAAADAQHVIETAGAVPYAIGELTLPAFNDISHNAWLWGIDTDSYRAHTVISFPSHMGPFSYGYAQIGAWRKVSKSLFDAIPSTDVRKGWFLNSVGYSANLNATQADYATSYGMPAYAQVKFAPQKGVAYGTQDNLGNGADIPLMRIEEMYLILAEAQAAMGNPTAAAATLNGFVRSYRDPAYNCTATTIEEAKDAVWMQRRIELWGEGFSYFDLMRMKKGVDRRGAGFQEKYIYNIAAGDDALIYPIPSNAMNANPQLVQNPEATQPTPVGNN